MADAVAMEKSNKALLRSCLAAVRNIRWRYLIPLATFALLWNIAVLAYLRANGFPFQFIPFGEISYLIKLMFVLVPIGALVALELQVLANIRSKMKGQSVRTVPDLTANIIRLIICGWALVLLYAIALIPYVNLKPAIPLLNSNIYDPQLELLERALFGGILPSEFLATISGPLGFKLWDLIYGMFGLFLFSSLMIGLQYGGMVSAARLLLALCIGLAIDLVLTLAWPTQGPIFVHPDWFVHMQNTQSLQLAAFLKSTVRDYALNPGHVYACSGISAMPSYHVYGWTCGFFCWRFLPPWTRIFGLLLVLLNWVSTVALGWHYALDGVAGILLAVMVWWLIAPLFRLKIVNH